MVERDAVAAAGLSRRSRTALELRRPDATARERGLGWRCSGPAGGATAAGAPALVPATVVVLDRSARRRRLRPGRPARSREIELMIPVGVHSSDRRVPTTPATWALRWRRGRRRPAAPTIADRGKLMGLLAVASAKGSPGVTTARARARARCGRGRSCWWSATRPAVTSRCGCPPRTEACSTATVGCSAWPPPAASSCSRPRAASTASACSAGSTSWPASACPSRRPGSVQQWQKLGPLLASDPRQRRDRRLRSHRRQHAAELGAGRRQRHRPGVRREPERRRAPARAAAVAGADVRRAARRGARCCTSSSWRHPSARRRCARSATSSSGRRCSVARGAAPRARRPGRRLLRRAVDRVGPTGRPWCARHGPSRPRWPSGCARSSCLRRGAGRPTTGVVPTAPSREPGRPTALSPARR